MINVQNVLVQQRPNTVYWMAVQWPEQRVMIGTADTREEAINSFVAAWNRRMKQEATVEDFRFFGPIKLTVTLYDTGVGWQATAMAERLYLSQLRPTVDEAKAEFILMWNEAHEDDEDVTDNNVDWQVQE